LPRSLTATLIVAALLPLVAAVLVWNIPRTEAATDALPGAAPGDGSARLESRRDALQPAGAVQSVADVSASVSAELGATRART
jgi:hypothetical protein